MNSRIDEAHDLIEPGDQHDREIHEGDDLADRGEAMQIAAQVPSRKIESSVSVAEARVATAATAHQDSTGICAASSASMISRSARDSASIRVKLWMTGTLPKSIGGAFGEVGIEAFDPPLHPLGAAQDEDRRDAEQGDEPDQQRGEPRVDEERQRQQHEERDEGGAVLAKEGEPQARHARGAFEHDLQAGGRNGSLVWKPSGKCRT